MGLYAVIRKNDSVPVAFSDDSEVCKSYFINNKFDTDEYLIVKVKKSNLDEIKRRRDYPDLYLVKVGHSYVNAKYYDEAILIQDSAVSVLNDTKKVLLSELECADLTNHERKALQDTVVYLEGKIEEVKSQRISDDELKNMKYQLDEFRSLSGKYGHY